MSTPERQQDPGEHGYGGVQQEKEREDDSGTADDAEPVGSDDEQADETPDHR